MKIGTQRQEFIGVIPTQFMAEGYDLECMGCGMMCWGGVGYCAGVACGEESLVVWGELVRGVDGLSCACTRARAAWKGPW